LFVLVLVVVLVLDAVGWTGVDFVDRCRKVSVPRDKNS
jgi:hypothetical protein